MSLKVRLASARSQRDTTRRIDSRLFCSPPPVCHPERETRLPPPNAQCRVPGPAPAPPLHSPHRGGGGGRVGCGGARGGGGHRGEPDRAEGEAGGGGERERTAAVQEQGAADAAGQQSEEGRAADHRAGRER